jgi:hypothetical protein
MKKFMDWVNENARKLVVRDFHPDGSLILDDGGKIPDVTSIRATNQPDDEIAGNLIYQVTAGGRMLMVSMDNKAARKVLPAVFKQQTPAAMDFEKLRGGQAPGSQRRSARFNI